MHMKGVATIILSAFPCLAYSQVAINQTNAMAGGVTVGDTAGFPVTISEPGSYRLTSNLSVQGPGFTPSTDMIVILASNVTLDLNGYTIQGKNSCTPPTTTTPVHCDESTTSGHGSGIYTESASNITIKNGNIQGMMGSGIWLANYVDTGYGYKISGVSVTSSGWYGITVGSGGELVENSTATLNLAQGFNIAGGRLTNVTAALNGEDGIYAIEASVHGANSYNNYGCGVNLIRAIFSSGTVNSNFHGGGVCATDGSLVTNLVAINNYPFGASIQNRSSILQSSVSLGSATGVTLSNNSCYKDITLSATGLTGGHALNGTNVLCNY